jgi:hypothetical protein
MHIGFNEPYRTGQRTSKSNPATIELPNARKHLHGYAPPSAKQISLVDMLLAIKRTAGNHAASHVVARQSRFSQARSVINPVPTKIQKADA